MKDVYIPYPFQTLGEEDIPEFIEVSKFSESIMSKEVNIKAKLSGSELDRVWIEVVTPELQNELFLELSDSQIDLVDDDRDGIYEASYSCSLPGKYSIYFYAINSSGYSAQTVKTEFTYVPDVKQDGEINIFDLVAVGRDFGKTGKNLKSDVNGDGKVDIFDLVVVGKHFGETVKAAPAIKTRRTHSSEFDQKLLRRIYKILKSQPNPTHKMQLALVELERMLLVKNSQVKLLPDKTKLLPNYPNPFNPETWIPFKLSSDAEVSIRIYNINGKLIRKIEFGGLPAGFYLTKEKAAYWDGCNSLKERVSSGVYFVQFDADEYRQTHRMTIVK